MITFDKILSAVIMICVFIYTMSYGLWTWKKKNRLGGIMVFVLGLAAIILPVYMVITTR